MDFSKLKEGVVAFSAFLVGHIAWLIVTFYSIWAAFGPQLNMKIAEAEKNVISTLNSDTAKVLLDTYGLKPLIPAFVLFAMIFVLHAHKEVLERAGRYIPPELIWHYMPGLRDIKPERWHYVLGQLGSTYSFNRVRAIIEARYSEAIKEYSFLDYSSAFDIFKSLALLNAILGLISISKFNAITFLLFCLLVIAATLTALLQVYHKRNCSHWAIEKVLNNLLAENPIDKHDIESENSHNLTDREIEAVKNFWKSDRQQPICSLSWSIPLIGNLRVLKESFFRSNRKHNKKDVSKGKDVIK